MHSHSAYPMKPDEANLKLIPFLKNKFKCKIGYRGHESGSYLICVTASLLGATSIERHITLDRTMYGSDQSASLEPEGLFRLIRDLRTIEKIQGDGKKRIWDSELPARKKLREVLVWKIWKMVLKNYFWLVQKRSKKLQVYQKWYKMP